MREEKCLFCKIAAKEISSEVVYEDEHTLAFLDISPRAPGHTVVISKYHAPSILSLPNEEINQLFSTVKKVDILLSEKLNPDGVTIGINQGKASGQEVDHLHIHLMPRWYHDKGGSVQSIVHNPPKESVGDLLKKILE